MRDSSRAYIEEHVRQGFVRPSLLHQLDHRVVRSEQFPKEARALDARFVPPYKRMESGGGKGKLAGRIQGLLRRVLGAEQPAASQPRAKE